MHENQERSETSTELESYASFVHGFLAAFHVLGAVYNAKKKNWWQVGVHVVVTGYDIWAFRKHYRGDC